ncbi:efflux RND transporter periplasmic adaptor subunit [Roseimicrobium sp. ORNL1]|uniref:efflux RND transporter periplasmic adaptor subunit n=1 Tax=Roseimicrobium sp. ORNL1 TaxID=2711231 RepID=UPI0013E10964|nr:efflux RND transporter periplasmic adaptor subunit [Roseimicrobium sp. ORNL1]QIF01083.1 HlyD family efflux transporter periplasmic adaptor subunit [Roseimicrobium sp. ORNL1]
MSLSDLYSPASHALPANAKASASPSPAATAESSTPLRRRILLLPAWLLPAVLILAFAGLFAFVFRDRLLPALEVQVAQAILLTDIDSAPAAAAGGEKDETASHHPTPPSPSTPAPNLAPSSPSPPQLLFQAAGWFEPDPLPIYATTLTDGVIAKVHVLEGQEVKQGQLLAELIADDNRISLDAAKRAHDKAVAEQKLQTVQVTVAETEVAVMADQVRAAEAKLAEEKDNEQRIAKIPSGSVSDQERSRAKFVVQGQAAEVASRQSQLIAAKAKVEAAKAQAAAMEAGVASAQVAVEKQELALARTRITSPVDGVILQLHAAPGQKKLLGMDDHQSATIATLFEKGKLQARVDVPLADARGLMVGQQAIVTSDFLPNTEIHGVVTRIVGSADLQRNTLQAKVRIENPDPRLRPEMLCRVKFLGTSSTPSSSTAASSSSSFSPSSSTAVADVSPADPTRAIMVPATALVTDSTPQKATSLWVISPDNSTATKRPAQRGPIEREGYVSITSGVLPGEFVILPPHDHLTEGRRVRVTGSPQ